MRGRLVILTLLGLLLAAMAAPAPTVGAATSRSQALGSTSTKWTFEVLHNKCTNYGGANGYGKSVLEVRQDEWGTSGTAQFRVTVVTQDEWGGAWHKIGSLPSKTSARFGNTSANHHFDSRFVYSWTSTHHRYKSRLRWVGRWLDGSGHTIAQQVINGRGC